MEENWSVIREILDYRMLMSAKTQHNQDASQMTPDQIEIWKQMVEAIEDENG
jgi:hypothetical protein